MKDIMEDPWIVLMGLNKIFCFYVVFLGDAEYDLQKTGTRISQGHHAVRHYVTTIQMTAYTRSGLFHLMILIEDIPILWMS